MLRRSNRRADGSAAFNIRRAARRDSPAARPWPRRRAHRCPDPRRRSVARRSRPAARRAAHAGTAADWNCFFRLRAGLPGACWNCSPPLALDEAQPAQQRHRHPAGFDTLHAQAPAPTRQRVGAGPRQAERRGPAAGRRGFGAASRRGNSGARGSGAARSRRRATAPALAPGSSVEQALDQSRPLPRCPSVPSTRRAARCCAAPARAATTRQCRGPARRRSAPGRWQPVRRRSAALRAPSLPSPPARPRPAETLRTARARHPDAGGCGRSADRHCCRPRRGAAGAGVHRRRCCRARPAARAASR